MSKKKLSAEEIDEVKKRLQEGANFPTETMEGLMIIDRKKAEYLLSLIDETEQLQRERDWINVEERLPEKGVKVLTCLGPYGLSVDIDFISEYSNENKFHYEPTATHWMPLPDPPKPEK